ncbi:MAG TPA: T9SS type A sorting domain-containing protein, partial [Bacteroidia bacterium]|nr:T9SS type A sorting domain-containing protein [Bacteroidia bacterium]
CVFFTDAMTGYIGGETAAGNSGLKKTIDGGATWADETYPDLAMASLIPAIAFSTPVTGYAANSYTSSNSIYGSFSQACGVYLGPDTTFCQTQGQLFATPATPGNNYVFDWTPGTGLSDSTVQSPFVSYVSNQQYVVTMTDTVTNCVATDTIVVSAYNWFVGNVYVCPPDSALLDFGPGAANYFWQFFTDTNGIQSNINQFTQTLWATEPGTYLGIANFTGCGNLTSLFTVVDSCTAAFICSVNAGPDTIFCQGQGQLHATPASPGNYTFSWSPSTGLNNPNIQNPIIISGVNNQQYVVTMTDTAQSCISTDTVVVSAYYYNIDTAYSCNNQPVTFDIGPGATNYTVQFIDTAGNFQSYVLPNELLIATEPVQYVVIAFYPGCGAMTSSYTVIDSCNVPVGNVWPGDCNYDLSVNMADALHIGLAYNATGPIRPNASNLWYAQPMTDWTQNYSNCNYKHGDADGNGTIDVNDTLPISLNYGNTHPYRLQPVVAPASAPQLYLVANYDTVGLQTLVTVDVRLGTSAVPIDSIYGISFRITSDAGLIDTALTAINLNTTWLGTMNADMFGFRKYFRTPGIVDVAECGNNHANRVNGNGTIATFLIVTTDNLSGIAVCHFNLSDITAVTEGQSYLNLNTVNDSVVIDPSHPAGVPEPAMSSQFSLYPNPANTNVTVQTNSPATSIEICDMLGRTISSTVPNSNSTTINTSTLAEGVYLLRVKNKNSISTQKLSVTH